MVFSPEQFVIITVPDWADEELATISRLVPLTGTGYEVAMFRDHQPGAETDPIRCVNKAEMRLATLDEIKAKRQEWEDRHNHKLSFTVIESGKGFAIATPVA